MIKPFEFSYRLECDLPNPTIFDYFKIIQKWMQDASIAHAEEIGYGSDKMREYNAFWAVARLRVKQLGPIINHHNYRIITWPNPYDLVGIDRNYQVFNENNQLIIIGIAKWVVIDKSSFSLIKPSHFELTKNHLVSPKEKIISEGYLRYDPLDPSSLKMIVREVQPSEIDQNTHVNNVMYLDYISEAFTNKRNRLFSISEYQINYSNSLFLTDKFTMNITDNDQEMHILAKTNDDNQLVFSAIIVY